MLDSTKSGYGPSLAEFDWADPFGLSSQLSEDERMIADSAAAYASDKIAPRVDDMYLNEGVVPEIFAEMGEMGLLGVTVSETWGGLGAGYVSYGLVAREIERIEPIWEPWGVLWPMAPMNSARNTSRGLPPASSSAALA